MVKEDSLRLLREEDMEEDMIANPACFTQFPAQKLHRSLDTLGTGGLGVRAVRRAHVNPLDYLCGRVREGGDLKGSPDVTLTHCEGRYIELGIGEEAGVVEEGLGMDLGVDGIVEELETRVLDLGEEVQGGTPLRGMQLHLMNGRNTGVSSHIHV